MNAIFRKSLMFVAVVLFATSSLNAQKYSAEAIMRKNDRLAKPGNSHSEITLVLKDKNGNKTRRELTTYSKKNENGYSSYFEVTAPADIAGMKLLSIARKGADDQWIYLPAFEKVRKISGSGKKGKFLGSDIWFYDLEDRQFEDFTYKANGRKTIDGVNYYVIISIPKDKNSPYSKIVNYVNPKDFFIYRSEIYDRKNSLLKTLVINKVKIINNIIVPVDMVYTTVKTGHSTHYILNSVEINKGVPDGIFSIKNLEE